MISRIRFPIFKSSLWIKSRHVQTCKLLQFTSCTIPEKATGGRAAPKQERLRMQDTKDAMQNRKEAGVQLQDDGKSEHRHRAMERPEQARGCSRDSSRR